MSKLHTLIRWTDPPLTGLVAGSGLVFLVSLSFFSFLSVVAYFGLSLVLVGVGCKCYLHLMGLLKKPCKDPLAGLESLDLSVTEEQMQGHLSNTLQYINTTVATLRNLLLMENYLNSAKFGLILYLLTFLGSFTNSLTLVTVAWVALFSLPTVYAAKQTEIDSLLDTVHTHYTALNTKLSSLLPAPTQEKTDQVKTQ